MFLLKNIKSIIEDAKSRNKKLWILFQDLSKVYNCVNIYMLNKTMARIYILIHDHNFIFNLFFKCFNWIIGHYSLMDLYDLYISIDQEEVISFLLS